MLSQAFEIKVALLGYVSVGKSTVLNALFQDKFSEVSMRRTTKGINFFRVSSRVNRNCEENVCSGILNGHANKTANLKSPERGQDMGIGDVTPSLSDEMEPDAKHAAETLQEIMADNCSLREKTTIQEKTFDIELEEPLFEMREDTRLVVIDIPGVNEAGSGKVYLDYVENNWDDFDCVIVVMDAVQGVNTEEQVKLLQFVRDNLEKKKEVPVIVLGNKVDDPDDGEVSTLVDEVRTEVENIFEVQDRRISLQTMLENQSSIKQPSPAFIPMSAGNAFVYRTASRLPLQEFRLLDKHYIDKIGREEVGRFKWKKLSSLEQYEEVYNVVSDPNQYQERLAATNFDKFLKVLEFFVGGRTVQRELIEKQLALAVKKLSSGDDIVNQLCSIHDRSSVLGKPVQDLKATFWSFYEEIHSDAFSLFSKDPMAFAHMQKPMELLTKYANGLHRKLHASNTGNDGNQAKKEDEDRIIASMKVLVKEQCGLLIEKEMTWDHQVVGATDPGGPTPSPAGGFAVAAAVGAQQKAQEMSSASEQTEKYDGSFNASVGSRVKQPPNPFGLHSTFSNATAYPSTRTFGSFVDTNSNATSNSAVNGASSNTSVGSSVAQPPPNPFGLSSTVSNASSYPPTTTFGSFSDANSNATPNCAMNGAVMFKTGTASDHTYCTLLTQFYHKHNPAKVSEVKKTLLLYKGKEVQMFEKLAKKYNAPNPLNEVQASLSTLPVGQPPFGAGASSGNPFGARAPSGKNPFGTMASSGNVSSNSSFGATASSGMSPVGAGMPSGMPPFGGTAAFSSPKNGFTFVTATKLPNFNSDTTAKTSGTEETISSTKPKSFSCWKKLSSRDWSTAIRSILLMSHNKHFCEHFGKQIVDLQWLAQTGRFVANLNICPRCNSSTCGCVKPCHLLEECMRGTFVRGDFVPSDCTKYKSVVQIDVPDSPSDPAHWGHLAWRFCEFMEQRGAN